MTLPAEGRHGNLRVRARKLDEAIPELKGRCGGLLTHTFRGRARDFSLSGLKKCALSL